MMKSRVKLRIDHSKMRARVNELSRTAMLRGARAAKKRYQQNIEATGRIGNGKMRDSVKIQEVPSRDPMVPAYLVGTPVPYAKYQEYGTRAHGPVRAKALRFKPKGSSTFVFAKWVRGVTPAKFAKKTLDQIRTSDFLP